LAKPRDFPCMKLDFPRCATLGLLLLPALAGAEVVISAGGTTQNAVIQRDAGTSTTTVRLAGPTQLDWQQFQINAGEKLQYLSDGGTSHASLNVVRGPLATIHGSITADGPFYLISPGGIQIGSTGSISAPQVLLSALAADQPDSLLTGGPSTFRKQGLLPKSVSVDGQISTPAGGAIILMGPSVSVGPNASLRAPEGRIQVIASDKTPVSGSTTTGFSLPAPAAGSGQITNSGTIAARQVHLLSDGFITNGGRLLSSGFQNQVRLEAPFVTHELRANDQSIIRTDRLLVQGTFRQQGPVLGPDDGANPSPIAGLRQTPRLSQPGFITTVTPGQTQLSHAPLQSTAPNGSPLPTPARNPALVAARRGPEAPKKATPGTVKKASFFGQKPQG